MRQFFEAWQTTANSFLRLPKLNVNIIFRQIAVPDFQEREELSNQLSELILIFQST